MNCFYHLNSNALGICKNCNKGICENCLNDTGNGIACKGCCTDEVIAINKLIDHNKKVVKVTPANWRSSGFLYVALGVIFMLTSVFYFSKFDPFLVLMGALFLGYGIYIFIRGKAFAEDPRDF